MGPGPNPRPAWFGIARCMLRDPRGTASQNPGPTPASCVTSEKSIKTFQLTIVRIPVDGFAAYIDRHRARLAELIERFNARFSPHAAVLETAPRRRRVEPVVIVDPDHAEFELARDAMRARDVLGPHGSGEAELRVVGDADRVRLV